tara:strand:+ start:347 stop:1144 length:798 start_codon:yes stop_codon:yes gene_type:complete
MDITVIINCYARPEYLKEQIDAIRSQTLDPREIWIWRNRIDAVTEYDKHLNNEMDERIKGVGADVVIDSSRNFKYHGRFSLGLLADTEYLAVFDDDTIPGKMWFKNCRDTMTEKGTCILGGAGVKLLSPFYVQHEREGWPSENRNIEEVDLVGHTWFFRRKTLNYLWEAEPFTFGNGEDIQFSAQAKMFGGIRTYCPPHYNKELSSSLKPWEYGNDKKASSNGSLIDIPTFYHQRDEIIEHFLDQGWKTVNDIGGIRDKARANKA